VGKFSVVERSIAELRSALETGEVTSVELVEAYLERIDRYDRAGIKLNSVVELNPSALEEAAASDRRRAAGEPIGLLEGIPFTAKDSFMVKGMTVASGSPAFKDLVANYDAFSIEALRRAGAVLIGLTNMPPMANGGMQRGLYGRAESPYSESFLTSAWTSGSSNGSGTATAASFAAFGLGEETWSSGRAPASCNALCAYTPSRGLISVRGNWPLVPTMDVVVPHTRTMADLCEVLDVLVAPDSYSAGDFWRAQPWVQLPAPSEVVAENFSETRRKYLVRLAEAKPLTGVRLAVPRMFIGTDPEQGTGIGIGAIIGSRIEPRPSVLELWAQARADLEAAGAEVVETDFPVVSNYEGDRAGAPNLMTRGLVSEAFLDAEIWDVSMWGWDTFLRLNGQPGLDRLTQVDGSKIFPRHPEDTLEDFTSDIDVDLADYVTRARERGIEDPFSGSIAAAVRDGLLALEKTRKIDFEQWLEEHGFDAAVFPTLVDVGPADAHTNPESAKLAKRNGVGVATGNLAIRHLGIPTVTVPMGLLGDIKMPVGLTFAGAAYSDAKLVGMASVFEALKPRRTPPPRTP
jgi:amidase